MTNTELAALLSTSDAYNYMPVLVDGYGGSYDVYYGRLAGPSHWDTDPVFGKYPTAQGFFFGGYHSIATRRLLKETLS